MLHVYTHIFICNFKSLKLVRKTRSRNAIQSTSSYICRLSYQEKGSKALAGVF